MIYFICVLLLVFLGPAPAPGDALFRYVAVQRPLFETTVGIFAVSDFLLFPGLLALYRALRETSRDARLVAIALL